MRTTHSLRKWMLTFGVLGASGAFLACSHGRGDAPNVEEARAALARSREKVALESDAAEHSAKQQLTAQQLRELQARLNAEEDRAPLRHHHADLPELDEKLPSDQLTMSEIQSKLKAIDVSSCKEQGALGVMIIKLTIERSGAVSSASPTRGDGAGPECVSRKVMGAKFREFKGDPMTLSYPFIIR